MPETLREILEDSQSIVFFGGAGVSTESGIPDFRSEGGLFRAQKEFGRLPEELLSHSFFTAHPAQFYRYYRKNLIHPNAQPNDAHRALAQLERRGTLRAVVTQNIDGLHQKAGNQTVLELHGSVLRNHCVDCGKAHSLEHVLDSSAPVPLCTACGGTVRPDVVLYEEPLDQQLLQRAVDAIAAADTLIVGGTSLAVMPAAGLLHTFRGATLVLINRTATPYDNRAQLVLRAPIGEVLGAAVF